MPQDNQTNDEDDDDQKDDYHNEQEESKEERSKKLRLRQPGWKFRKIRKYRKMKSEN